MTTFISIILIAVSVILFMQYKQDMDYALNGAEASAIITIVEKLNEPVNIKNRNKKLDDTYVVYYEFELGGEPIRGKDYFYSFTGAPNIGSHITVQYMKNNPTKNRIKPR